MCTSKWLSRNVIVNIPLLTHINVLFRYTRNKFGIKSLAGEFQKAMDIFTAGLEGVGIFKDNIIVARSIIIKHNAWLSNKLLNVLCNASLRVKFKNVLFSKFNWIFGSQAR